MEDLLMKKLYSFLVIFVCLFTFIGPSNAATGSLLNQDNEVISSTALASIMGDISPNLSKIKSALSTIGRTNLFGKLTVSEKATLIYEEEGVQLYLAAALEKSGIIYKPVVKLKVVMDNKVIIEGNPDTITGTLSFKIGYRWDGYITLALDTESQDLIINSADLGMQIMQLHDMTIAIGILPHNQGTVDIEGVIVIDGFPVDIGALKDIIELLMATA